MTNRKFEIREQNVADEPAVESLLDQAFGPTRRHKAAYRLREAGTPVKGLTFAAVVNDWLVGTIQFWPVAIGDVAALLLGPLAVAQEYSGHECGIALMQHGLTRAREMGHKLVILVGDEAYYSKVGFAQIPMGQVTMPGPVDLERLLYCELAPASFDGVIGQVKPLASLAEPDQA